VPVKSCSNPSRYVAIGYAIEVNEQKDISTVVEITINFKAIVCASSHDFGVEMHTGIHVTKVADELHRASKSLADFLERRFIRIKLVENVLYMLFERSRRSQPRVQFPPAAWPLLRGLMNRIAFSCHLGGFHTKPARYVVRIERTSDVKVCIPRVRFLHGQNCNVTHGAGWFPNTGVRNRPYAEKTLPVQGLALRGDERRRLSDS
jgi:hypothetical protein